MKLKYLSSLLLLLSLYSCSSVPQYEININSFARADSEIKKKYVLRSGDKNIPESDLQFIEFQNYVRRGLNSRGLVYTEQIEDADLIILINYGIGEPQTHTYTYSAPVWGQTGYSSARTVGTYNSYGSFGTYSANTTLTPTYGITGYAPLTCPHHLVHHPCNNSVFSLTSYLGRTVTGVGGLYPNELCGLI